MNSDRVDPLVMSWLSDDVEAAPREGLTRALAAVDSVAQRPGWTFPQRWLPGSLVGLDGRPSRSTRVGILVAITLLALLALAAAFVGSQMNRLPERPSGDVFVYQDGDSITVAARDGSGLTQVNGGVPFGRTPVFSPDGKMIAFTAPAASGSLDGQLLVVPFDGSTPPIDVGDGLVLTPSQTSQFSWSPISTELVFSAMEDGATKLFVANADGSGAPQQITDGLAAADLPDWNSNTDLIAYRSKDADGLHANIIQISTNGTDSLNKTGVVAADAFISRPRWRLNDHHLDDSLTPAWVLAYSINEGFGTDTSAKIDEGMGPVNPLPLTSPVGDWEGGLPWSPNGSQVAVLTDDGVVLAAFDVGYTGTAHPYDGEFLDLGNVINCWVEWSPDGLSLYGGSLGSCDHIVQVPIADPTSAQTLPMTISGPASWRPQPEVVRP
jgi:hypothetical protein